MNTTRYEEGCTITTLDPINASEWMQHDWRAPIREMVKFVMRERDDIASMRVEISPTSSTVTLISDNGKDLEVITFRHWCNGYAGCIHNETMAYSWCCNQWVNLN